MVLVPGARGREGGDLPLVFFQQLGFRSIGFTCHDFFCFFALHPHSFMLHLPLFRFGLEYCLRSAPPIWIVLFVFHTLFALGTPSCTPIFNSCTSILCLLSTPLYLLHAPHLLLHTPFTCDIHAPHIFVYCFWACCCVYFVHLY